MTMQKRIKQIASVVGFAGILLFLLIKVSHILEDKQSREQYRDFYECDTNIDVIFMGTSHMYNSVYPMQLWEEYGISSYNWGFSNCTLAEDYYLMQEVVKYTDPRLFVVDLYGTSYYENFDGYGNGKYRPDRILQQHVQFDSLPFSANKYRAVKDIFDDYEDNADFLWNILIYHGRWNELKKKDFQLNYSPEYGARFQSQLGKAAGYGPVEKKNSTDIDTACSQYIPMIIDFCRKEGIALLFTYLPYGDPTQEEVDEAWSLKEYLQGYGAEDYLNIIYWEEINPDTDFYKDDSHLNFSGGSKLTKLLGEYILSRYDLENHKKEKDYASWDEAYQTYMKFRDQKIKAAEDIYSKLMLCCGGEYFVAIKIDTDNKILESDHTLASLVSNLGSLGEVEYKDKLKYKKKAADLILEIYDVHTEKLIDRMVCSCRKSSKWTVKEIK